MGKSKKYRSISSQLGWQVTGTVCLAMLGLIILLWVTQYRDGIDRLKSKSKTSLDLISQALEMPVWNFDDIAIEKLVEAFIGDNDLKYIDIVDAKKKVHLSIIKAGTRTNSTSYVSFPTIFV